MIYEDLFKESRYASQSRLRAPRKDKMETYKIETGNKAELAKKVFEHIKKELEKVNTDESKDILKFYTDWYNSKTKVKFLKEFHKYIHVDEYYFFKEFNLYYMLKGLAKEIRTVGFYL